MGETARLMWLDYLIFSSMLFISVGIGIYHACSGGKQRTTSEFLLGNRAMGIAPVAISLMVTRTSALTLLGYPAEVYAHGPQWFIATIGSVIGSIGAVYLFLPVLYPLKLTSANEYLVLRYKSKLILYMGSFYTVFGLVFWVGNAMYVPAAAIESVTGIPSWCSVAVTCIITTIYSSIGGYKSVIWTDVFQALIMYTGVLIVLIKSLIAIGGFIPMVEYAKEWDRATIFDFDPSPMKRLNFYGALIGSGLSATAVVGYTQIGFQRYSSLSTIGKARKLIFVMTPGLWLMKVMTSLCGVTVFVYYASRGCDPKAGGQITSYNQIMSYFVSDAISIPGIPGLFIAAVYAASLSSASSALNSAAACAWRDVLKDFYPGITEYKAAVANKILTVICGLMGLGLSLAVDNAGGTVLQIGYVFGAATGGTHGALFIMGIFLPWINWKGAAVGCLFGMGFGTWISLGNYMFGKHWEALPVPSSNCYSNLNYTMSVINTTSYMTTGDPLLTTDIVYGEPQGINILYNISFVWLREIITGSVIVVSLVVSGMAGANKPRDVEGRLVHPFLRKCFKFREIDDNEKKMDAVKPLELEKMIIKSETAVLEDEATKGENGLI